MRLIVVRIVLEGETLFRKVLYSMQTVPVSFVLQPTSQASIRTWKVHESTFLPRDAMRKRRTSCRPVSVCLSVCPFARPSVTLVYCIQSPNGSRYRQTLFLGLLAQPRHSSFLKPSSFTQIQIPLARVKYTG